MLSFRPSIVDALTMAVDRAGVSHNVEEGPNAGWVDVPGEAIGYFEEDYVCTADCPACEVARVCAAALEEARANAA